MFRGSGRSARCRPSRRSRRPRARGRRDLAAGQRRRPHRPRSQNGRVRQQQRLCRDLDRLHRHFLGRVRDVADQPETVAGADRLGAEFGQPVMRDGAGLEIADIVRRVMDELHMPDAALVRLFEPFEPAVEKIQPLDVGDDRRLAGFVGRVEIGRAQRPAHAVIGDQLVHPGEPVEMVAVQFARRRGAHERERRLPRRGRAPAGPARRRGTQPPARLPASPSPDRHWAAPST